MNSNFKFFRLLIIILKNRKALLINFIAVGIISLITSLLLPKWYRADGLVIIPNTSGISGIAQFFSDISMPASLTGANTDAERFITLAYSREVLDSMIVKFNLLDVYDYEYRFKLRKYLREKIISADINDDGSIHFGFIYPKDKKKPGEILNFLIHKVDSLYKKLNTLNAHYQRVFLENQYDKVMDELFSSEDSLARFQKKYSVLDLPEQIKSSIELISSLEAERIQNEINLQVLFKTMKPDAPQIRQLENRIAILKDQLHNYQYGSLDSTIIISFKDTPEIGLEYYRLMRDIKIREKILEFLVPQLEQAKVEEVKNTPSLLIVDPGVPAEYKSKPKRAVIVILSVLGALILHILYLLTMEYVNKKKDEDPEFEGLLKEIKTLAKWKSN